VQTLEQLPIGKVATIHEVGGPRAFRRRLMELGLVPGTNIKTLNIAPFGDPIEIEVRSARLSIRIHEAKRITVTS
jgi:ferrous iron transport protein A